MKFLIIFTLSLIVSSSFGSLRHARLVGGHLAKDGYFPYQVGIKIYLYNSGITWCGGSLINNEWILTAAHCTQEAKSVDVSLGATKISAAKVVHPVERSNFIIHPDWNRDSMLNDISLIRIPFTDYSSNIQPIQFPSAESYNSYKAAVAGWGNANDVENKIFDELKWGYLKVISNEDCIKAYPKSVNSGSICVATTEGISTCGGDSGGPLVLSDSNVVIGVSSFTSTAGCTKGYPAVFTRVSSYLDWIKSYTEAS